MNVYGGNNQNVVSGTQNITNQTTHYGSKGSWCSENEER